MPSDQDIKVVHDYMIQEGVGRDDVQGGEKDQVIGEDAKTQMIGRTCENSLEGKKNYYLQHGFPNM